MERYSSTEESNQCGTIPLLVCTKCKEGKPHDQYYRKGTRIESFCKGCKKREQQKAYQKRKGKTEKVSFIKSNPVAEMPVMEDFQESVVQEQTDVPVQPDKPSEPIGAEIVPDRLTIEPENNFGFWEKKYNRKLTEEEKIEIHSNLLALVKTLKEEYRIKTV